MMKNRTVRRHKRMANRLLDWLGEVLYPHAANCLCCGEARFVSEEDCLCTACRERIRALRVPAAACNRCLMPIKAGQPCRFCASSVMEHISAAYAPFRYGGEVRTLIHAFKFGACNEPLVTLAEGMADALTDRAYDYLVPVPLHKRRLLERGVNQARLLADALSVRTGIPVREALVRVQYHTPQSKTRTRKERSENVRGVFRCDADVKGQRLLLIDDVRTSGSTAAECARVLKEGGAEKIGLCVCAVVYRLDAGGAK